MRECNHQAMAEPMPIGRIFTTLAEQDPNRPSVTCSGETISRLELERNANRLARAYAELGVQQGDFVTIGLPNSIEFYEATIATWKLGAVPQPVSAKLPARASGDRRPRGARDRRRRGASGPSRARVHPAGFAPDSALADDPLPDAVAPAWKAPTSGGSTGRPKLIVAGQDRDSSTLTLISFVFRMEHDDTHLMPGPLYHNGPFSLSTVGLLMGNHVVRRCPASTPRSRSRDRRAPRPLDVRRADDDAADASRSCRPRSAIATTSRRCASCGTSPRRARRG